MVPSVSYGGAAAPADGATASKSPAVTAAEAASAVAILLGFIGGEVLPKFSGRGGFTRWSRSGRSDQDVRRAERRRSTTAPPAAETMASRTSHQAAEEALEDDAVAGRAVVTSAAGSVLEPAAAVLGALVLLDRPTVGAEECGRVGAADGLPRAGRGGVRP